jgi:EmrB/QacA subfamily drug resistance transporter
VVASLAVSAPASPPARVKHPNEVLAVLLLAGLAYALSQTLVIPALPALARDYHASPSAASWIITGYLLSASVATPIIGKLGDLYGKGRVLTGVLIAFSIGSVVCALATSIGLVIVGRVVQGAAGGVFPLAFGIIRDTFPRERVAGGIGILSAIFGIGGGIGLPLSGVIVDHLDVSIIFWLGLVAVPAAAAAHFLIPASPSAARARIDWAGAGLLSVILAAVLLGVTEANDWGWTSGRTLALIVGGLALVPVWLALEASRTDPLIDLGVLRRRAVATTNLAGLMVGFAMFSSFLLIPQFAQAPKSVDYGLGLSVTQSGLILLPCAAIQLIAGPLAGRLGTQIGFRTVLAAGTILSSFSFLLLAFAHSHPWQLVVAGAFLGAGVSFAFAAMANLVVDAVPQSDVGIATGINTIMRTVGGAFGAAVATAVLTADTVRGTHIPAESAYTIAFLLAAAGGVLALLASLLIPTRASASATPVGEPVGATARG